MLNNHGFSLWSRLGALTDATRHWPRSGAAAATALWALPIVAALSAGCSSQDAIVLSIRPPAGVALKQYAVTIQDRDSRLIIYKSGVQPFDAATAARDLNASPLKLGLKLTKGGNYLVHVRAADSVLAPDGVTLNPRLSEWFFAGLINAKGTSELAADLLEVKPQFDVDADHFPDAVAWPAAQPAAQSAYQGHPELLDCVDHDPTATEMPLPIRDAATMTPFMAGDINPLVKPLCGLSISLSCEGTSPVCQDRDGDGDSEATDCDDNDPKRFHGNPRPRNCCQCTDKASCGTNHAKLADQSVCQPARCDDPFDYDCTGNVVPCFVDEDCDGYSPNDPIASLRDCDDTNPSVHPGAAKKCADPSHDWACDGNPSGGCVACDLDGDGYQRIDAANGCPTATYNMAKGIDCDDNDRGVFPGSTSLATGDGPTLLVHDLAGKEGGGSVAAALRGLCRNTAPTIPATAAEVAQNADCDVGNKPRDGCPASIKAGCDADGDGFPNAGAGCNTLGIPTDCNDADPHIFPGAPDICGDTIKQNCVADRLCTMDKDGDKYQGADDCDDNNALVHPWAIESCNGTDDDCDGLIDEGNPDPSGAAGTYNGRLITKYTGAGAKTYIGISSCTDNNLGSCGLTDPTLGNYSGRCVCTGVIPAAPTNPLAPAAAPPFMACVGTKATGIAPRCFGATQPAQQTCKASTPTDEDCDGRVDAPDGKRLAEAGTSCGPVGVSGLCKAGKVIGCDRAKTNAFFTGAGSAVFPAFDPERKFLTCDNTAVFPATEICDLKDNNCNNKIDEFCAVNGVNTCCGTTPMCVDLTTDPNNCSKCGTQCSVTAANRCAASTCMCGMNPACSGTNSLCKGGATCVQCLADADCPGGACNTTTNTCVQCTAGNATACVNMTPVCNTANGACVQCNVDTDCKSPGTLACDTATHSCVQCTAANVSACTAAGMVCDVAAKKCVGCLADGDCKTAAAPACDTTAKSCVACTTTNKTGCKGATPVCDTAKEKCVGCLSAATDCKTPGLLVCDPTLMTCVECDFNADCSAVPGKKKCKAAANTCVQCLADADCPGVGATCVNNVCNCAADTACASPTPKCNVGTSLCVQCLASGDCSSSGTTPICTTNTCGGCANTAACNVIGRTTCNGDGSCSPCASNASCTFNVNAPICGGTGSCGPCTADTDCAGQGTGSVCKVATGACICVTSADCPLPTAGYCNAGACTACAMSADCTGNPNGNVCTGTKCVCSTFADCPLAVRPICTAGSCTQCVSDADCVAIGKTTCNADSSCT